MEIRKIWKRLNWSLAMNRKSAFALLLLFASISIYAQNTPSLTLGGSTHIYIQYYAGASMDNGISITFEGNNGAFKVGEHWKIGVTAIPGAVANRTFPADKIMAEVTSISGQGNNLTIPDLGIPPTTTFADNSEVFIIPSSPTSLINDNGYYRLYISFKLHVLGGQYLSALSTSSWPTYPIIFKAVFYGPMGEVLDSSILNYRVQVSGSLEGNVPGEDTYSIQISGAAREGALEVRTIEDYANGVSTTYEDGLTVKAGKGYQVAVKSAQPAFTSASGREVPLNTVNVALHPRQNGTTTFQKTLSDTGQQVASGSATGNETHKFDIRYSIAPNNNQLLNFKPDTYSTVLQYTLTPQ